MATEDELQAQLAEERAEDRKIKTKETKTEKTGFLKGLLKNPLVQLSCFGLLEASPAGILPGWIGFVIVTFFQEKKAGLSPNIAIYMIVGSAAAIVDAINVFDLTGFGLFLSRALGAPFFCLLIFWRLNKQGLSSAMSTKPRVKKA